MKTAAPLRHQASLPNPRAKAPVLWGHYGARSVRGLLVGRLCVSNAAKEREVVVGIDLGTTNSAVAVLQEDGRPTIVPTADGATLPSVVAFLDDGSVLVGKVAKRQAAANPSCTFYSVKRLIGRDCSAVQDDARQVAYAVEADEDGAVRLACHAVEGGGLYPEEVSAYIVAELLAAAEAFTGAPVRKAVISVPAYFNEAQREATAAAGRLAGLEVVRLVREPVAAALAYGVTADEDQTVLVLDLGGGTWDVSILEVGGGVVEVLSTGGDAHLGGDDFDNVIVEWLAKEHLQGLDWRAPRFLANLRALAEAAKVRLSDAPRVALRVPGAVGSATLTRQQLESLATPLFRRLRLPIDVACWQAGVDLGTALEAGAKSGAASGARGAQPGLGSARPKRRAPVSALLLVGGATRMPAFRRFVRNMTGLEPAGEGVDPDQAVALGAAVQAGILEGSLPGHMVMDIWQATLMRALATRRLQADDAAAEHFLEPQDSDAGAEAWGPDIGGEEILDAGEAPDDLSPS